jgi:uncharacterized damage-inducible protein DinB
MAIRDAFLAEFDHEMIGTRKTLERVPEGKPDWKPHDRSMSIGRLAGHVAEIPGWAVETIERDSLDVNPPGAAPMQPNVMKSRKELLELFDRSVAKGRAAIAGASDEALMKPWSLLNGGQQIFTLPRVAVLRAFVMSHLVHHRAQLGVYLRLNNVPLPAIYGPSADENIFQPGAAKA